MAFEQVESILNISVVFGGPPHVKVITPTG
jgi:hypothetical protein